MTINRLNGCFVPFAQGRRSAKYCNSTFLAWTVYMNTFNVYNFLLLYVMITLSVVKLVIATGHAMQAFNYLHYSNRCRFIGVA
jgi:hypothetical protein